MPGSVQEARKNAQRHLHRRVLLALDCRKLLFLLEREIAFSKRRVQNYVRKEFERWIEFRLQGRKLNDQQIHIGISAQLCSNHRQLIPALQLGSRLRSSVQKR